MFGFDQAEEGPKEGGSIRECLVKKTVFHELDIPGMDMIWKGNFCLLFTNVISCRYSSYDALLLIWEMTLWILVKLDTSVINIWPCK